MADKNPFITCKSRKKRKRRAFTKDEDKPYCPSAMVRYDGGKRGYPTLWACKMCMTCCLSDIAAAQHSLDCRKKTRENRKKKTKKMEEPTLKYNCRVCKRSFSRQVALKKHMEVHQKQSSDCEIIDDSDSESIVVKKIKSKRGRKKASVVDDDFLIPPTKSIIDFDPCVPSTSKAAY